MPKEAAVRLGLPAAADNLFARIIGNPYPAGPRERACAEMLCGVLRNAPSVRTHLLQCLGRLAGAVLPRDLASLDFEIQTERAVPGGKRDDLRIEAWSDPERSRRVLLWSLEAKVSAGFHYGPRVLESDEETAEVAELAAPDGVHQLLNYDAWLMGETADSVEGFVLGCSNLAHRKPPGLQLQWPCVTWTWLGLKVEESLGQELANDERFLAKHLCGFIRKYLWSSEEASAMEGQDTRLDLDDVALIRAFGAIGKETIRRVDETLLKALPEILSTSGLGLGPVSQTRALFKSSARSIAYGSFFGKSAQIPYLCAGLVTERGTSLAVWIETSPGVKVKQQLHDMFSRLLPSLNASAEQRGLRWVALDASADGWWDLEVRLPIERVLGAEDQVAMATEFFRGAVADLGQCRVGSALATAFSVEAEAP